MIEDLPLRWAVTALFLLSGIGFALVLDRRSWTSAISHVLHLTMVIAMAVMAWPQGRRLPATPAEVFFLAAAVWFVMTAVLAARVIASRLARGYHAVKMLAMAWMYAVMGGHLTPGSAHAAPDMSMPGMEMAEAQESTSEAAHNWIGTGNWAWVVVFSVAALVWGYRFLKLPRRRGRRCWRKRLGSAVQVMTAVGMAIMFAVLATD